MCRHPWEHLWSIDLDLTHTSNTQKIIASFQRRLLSQIISLASIFTFSLFSVYGMRLSSRSYFLTCIRMYTHTHTDMWGKYKVSITTETSFSAGVLISHLDQGCKVSSSQSQYSEDSPRKAGIPSREPVRVWKRMHHTLFYLIGIVKVIHSVASESSFTASVTSHCITCELRISLIHNNSKFNTGWVTFFSMHGKKLLYWSLEDHIMESIRILSL